MSIPDFSRAEYASASAVSGSLEREPTPAQIAAGDAFPMAVLLGTAAAMLCTLCYAFVWSLGFMLSILVVGFAWVISKAMLTASDGYGGKLYQVVAVLLTYFTVTCGEMVLPVWTGYHHGSPLSPGTVLSYVLFGPVLSLQTGYSGIIGIFILGYAIRMAWKMGKGTRTA
jgi:hypothetical protein